MNPTTGAWSSAFPPLATVIRSAFDDAPIGMALTSLDRNGNRTIQMANTSLGAFLGRTPADLIGRTFNDLTHPDDLAPDNEGSERLRTGSLDVYAARKRYRHADGSYRWGALHARVLHHNDTLMTLAHIIDIEAQVRLENELAGRAHELEDEVARRTSELADSDHRLRLSLIAARASTWTYDIDNAWIDIDDNGVWSRTDGNALELLDHADEERVRAAIAASVTNAEPFDLTVRFDDPASTSGARWMRLSGDATLDDDGQAHVVFGIAADVTAEAQIKEQEREQRTRLDMAMRASSVDTWEHDPVAGTVTLGPQTSEFFGLDPATPPTSRQVFEAVHPADRDDLRQRRDQAIASGEAFDGIVRAGSDSAARWLHVWGQPVLEGGRTSKLIGIVQDITAERRDHAELKEREQRMSLLLDATTSSIGEWDLVNDRRFLSDGWFRAIGYEPGELDIDELGWQPLVHPDDWPELQRQTEALRKGELPQLDLEFRVKHRDGTWRWNHHRGRVVEWADDGRAARIIGVDTDVTEQHRFEEQLLHSAKMQSLGALAGGIAHDFNNIMAIVQGHTDVLVNEIDRQATVGSDERWRLETIQRSISRAASLVRNLMVLARPETNEAVPIDLRDIVSNARSSLPHLLGADIRIEIDLCDGPAIVNVDESRFDAVLLNLAANARDAMPTGGTLRLVLRNDQQGVSGKRGQVILEVSDDGIGMDESTLDSIFEPFFTTKAPGVGTGLGLATSYSTIAEAGGMITASSSPGVGTTVIIELPECTEQTRQVVPAPAHSPVSRPNATLLVVEDEPDLLELTAESLRTHGFRVHEALGAIEALEILEQDDDIELILTDVVMPGMSGTKLAGIVYRRWPHVAVRFMSGYAVENPAIARIEPADLIEKPFTDRALLDTVNRALAVRRSDHR